MLNIIYFGEGATKVELVTYKNVADCYSSELYTHLSLIIEYFSHFV